MSTFTVHIAQPVADRLQRVIHVSGSPYDQGVQHGEQARELILRNLEAIRLQLAKRPGELVRRAYEQAAAHVQRAHPDNWAEYEGLAHGSGLPLDDVLTLNLKIANVLDWLRQDCSQFAKVVRTPSGATRTLISKTRDQLFGPVEHIVLVRSFDDGSEMLEVHKAGILGYPGSIMTSHGLALGTSGVWSPRTPFDVTDVAKTDIGSDGHKLMRHAKSIDELPEIQSRQPRLTGINNVVAESGRVAGFEVTAKDAALREADDGLAVLTNHYTEARFADLAPTEEENPSTFARLARLRELLADAASAEDFWEVIQDHGREEVDRICRHDEPGGDGRFTTYASVMEIETRTAWVAMGQPCACAFPVRDAVSA